MGLTWNLAALIATIAILLIIGAVWNKAKQKKDSPLYKLISKFKRDKNEDMIPEQTTYRRLSHKGGIKW